MSGRVRAGLAFAVYCALALVLFQPWLAQFSTVLLGPPENNLQDFWNVWHAARTHFSGFFHAAGLRFPDGTNLNYHSFSYPHVLVVGLLADWLGSDRGGLIWLNNAALFASFPLSGVFAFLLVRRFVPNTWAALIGGFIFAFNPWHVAQAMHHAHVTHIEFVPLFVLAYLNGLERKSLVWLAGAAVAGALAALSCWYFLFYDAYFVLFHALYRWRRNSERLRGWSLKAPAIALGGTVLLLTPLIVPMLMLTGGVEHPGGTDAFVADLEAFVAFPTTHVFADWSASFWARAHKWTSNNTFEGAAYLGLVNLALLVWLWRRRRQDSQAHYLVWVIGVFAVLAMGDCLHAFGFDTLIPLPGIIPNHLPLFSQVRTPGRSMVMVFLFLGVAVAYGLTLLAERWRDQRWVKPALAAIALLIVVDFVPVHLEYTDARCSAGLAIIARDSEPGFGVTNLPLHDNGDRSMFEQTCHGKPVTEAAISRSFRPPLSERLDRKNLSVVRAQLLQAHVKYLVINETIAWDLDPNPPKYAMRRWAVATFPSLAKVKWIAPPRVMPSIPKAAYKAMFPTVYSAADLTILRVQ
jgi:hypothetical protein